EEVEMHGAHEGGLLPGVVRVAPTVLDAVDPVVVDVISRQTGEAPAGGRELLVGVVAVVQGNADLTEVAERGGPVGGNANLLDRWHQQANQDRDDRNHHQELDERKGAGTEKRTKTRHNGTS